MERSQVFPGIIDNDDTGEIKIMAKALHNIITIPAEKRIAQLILLPMVNTSNQVKNMYKGSNGCGSR